MKNTLFEKVYFIQRIRIKTNKVFKEDQVIGDFIIKKELEFQVSNVYKIRVSEVIKWELKKKELLFQGALVIKLNTKYYFIS